MSYTSEFHIKSPSGDKVYVGDYVRCSYSKNESSGCWHGQITNITSRGLYFDVGNKRDKYVCFVDVTEISLKKEKPTDGNQ